jgi:hypothetical protein
VSMFERVGIVRNLPEIHSDANTSIAAWRHESAPAATKIERRSL